MPRRTKWTWEYKVLQGRDRQMETSNLMAACSSISIFSRSPNHDLDIWGASSRMIMVDAHEVSRWQERVEWGEMRRSVGMMASQTDDVKTLNMLKHSRSWLEEKSRSNCNPAISYQHESFKGSSLLSGACRYCTSMFEMCGRRICDLSRPSRGLSKVRHSSTVASFVPDSCLILGSIFYSSHRGWGDEEKPSLFKSLGRSSFPRTMETDVDSIPRT